MSNKRYQQFSWSNATQPITINAQIAIGATGAPTITYGNNNIATMVRNSAGDYTLTFRSVFYRLINASVVFNSGSSLPAAPLMNIKANSISTAKTLEIVFSDADTPAATDPASGEIMYLSFVFENSSVSNA